MNDRCRWLQSLLFSSHEVLKPEIKSISTTFSIEVPTTFHFLQLYNVIISQFYRSVCMSITSTILFSLSIKTQDAWEFLQLFLNRYNFTIPTTLQFLQIFVHANYSVVIKYWNLDCVGISTTFSKFLQLFEFLQLFSDWRGGTVLQTIYSAPPNENSWSKMWNHRPNTIRQ